MKKTKMMSFILAVLMTVPLLSLASCSAQKKYTIGICQLVTHDALDAATNGFRDAVIAQLGEENVTFDFQNAGNSADTCGTIVNSFVSKNVDLILANATPALQAAANYTESIPILGTSITEYGVALDITNFNGTVGGNISGTSDLAPLDQQAQMLLDLVPEAKTVGVLYCSAEANSAYQVRVVQEYLTARGITCKEYKFADSNDVSTVTAKASTECDALYIPTDNTAASCAETIYHAMVKKIPIVTGEENTAKGCGIASLTIDYYEIGYATGLMAAKILKGEAKISEMPIEYAATFTKKYNPTIAGELGIQIPADYVAIATE